MLMRERRLTSLSKHLRMNVFPWGVGARSELSANCSHDGTHSTSACRGPPDQKGVSMYIALQKSSSLSLYLMHVTISCSFYEFAPGLIQMGMTYLPSLPPLHEPVSGLGGGAHVQVQMLDSNQKGEVTFQEFCRYITMLPDAQVRDRV